MKTTTSKRWSIVLALALGAACFGTDTGLLFSHGEHPEQIEDEEGFDQCTACHTLAADGIGYSLPSHQGATGCYGPDGACHSIAVPIEEATENPSRYCTECHTTESGEVIWHDHVYTDVLFAHSDHESDPDGTPLACASCHEMPIDREDFGEINRSSLAYPVSMEECISCHVQKSVAADCATCHVDRRIDVPPPSHQGAAFELSHGREAERSTANCNWCHEGGEEGAFCNTCHQTVRPRSHVSRWDQSLHGRMARHDRRRCATCHEAEYCQACHAVAPRSHSQPRFRSPGDGHQRTARSNVRSCQACHVYAADCAECHSR